MKTILDAASEIFDLLSPDKLAESFDRCEAELVNEGKNVRIRVVLSSGAMFVTAYALPVELGCEDFNSESTARLFESLLRSLLSQRV